jgi:Leucine-rich repeat (LRR) protein
LHTIQKDLFKDLKNLTELNLKNNRLTQLDAKKVFKGLDNLYSVDLSFNPKLKFTSKNNRKQIGRMDKILLNNNAILSSFCN